jgi:hypothetical protein
MRGFLRGFDPGVDKIWRVDLLETDVVWQRLVNGGVHPELDSRTDVRRRVEGIKQKHKEYFDRRFIYFICTRTRVRFATDRPPRFSWLGRKLMVYVRVEGRRRPVRCAIPSRHLLRVDMQGRVWRPAVTTSDVALTLTYSGRYRETISIHDFLITHNINLGIDTYVHYVGMTMNPDTRPLLRRHDGRARAERRARRENRDVFFFYNTFAVRYHAPNPDQGVNWWVSNAFTDDVEIRAEGLTIEKLFVAYLHPDCQGSMKSELGELRGRLNTLATRHRVQRIDVGYEVDCPSEYYRFYSDAVQPSADLSFSVVTSGPFEPQKLRPDPEP